MTSFIIIIFENAFESLLADKLQKKSEYELELA